MNYDQLQIVIMLLAGILAGFAKTGLATLGILNAALMTQVFPAKQAVGTLLPVLIVADIIAVVYYRRNVVWKYLISLIPWVLIGIAFGYVILRLYDDTHIKFLLGLMLLILIGLQVLKDRYGTKLDERLPSSKWFTSTMGILAGYATMVGNVSGVIMSMYLFGKKLPKQEFVGTGAWFYLVVNLLKVPLYFQLDMITTNSLILNLWSLPAIAIGAFIGVRVIPRIPIHWFQRIILLLGAVGAIKLMIPA
ncbi:sulfite exporter TauE/SafE family protein [Paenibacillus cremeus]|uniref:Probable membrane transporter protein n=1 Tax=Paenibacillus cremeus TaxID=2163881 RepID=A0A559K330_9BACL|nr:sulfite exporter TauE/SafE family protein [Paenibacillus cremeus]TVY06558.1 sulfite exporter TauE/SafE family protein [Paenibacillus cremeus]